MNSFPLMCCCIEAVQEERQKNRDSEIAEADSSTSLVMPLDEILAAELAAEPKIDKFVELGEDAVTQVCQVSPLVMLTPNLPTTQCCYTYWNCISGVCPIAL